MCVLLCPLARLHGSIWLYFMIVPFNLLSYQLVQELPGEHNTAIHNYLDENEASEVSSLLKGMHTDTGVSSSAPPTHQLYVVS